MSLPVLSVLPDLLQSLRARPNAVLVAPPGAGKTTAIAPALIQEDWCEGQVLLLSPRRLPARAAAERMAEMTGEPVGRTIGYATRMDSRHGLETRVLVMTEGIFRNRIQDDPELRGVSAVLFDEVHERNIDSDFGLALALDVQEGLRPDLRLLAMSATLDGSRFARLMGDAPVIESAGRSWPLTLRHVGRGGGRIEDEMTATIRQALREEEAGDILAFLPGVAEIERTAERLANLPAHIRVLPLHGTLPPAAQREAIRRAAPGERKLILATSIAETSLTIDGVRIVVDSGLARRPRYDRAAGVTRLVTERASQAAVTQRAGRAARQAPGIAYRLWEEAGTAGLPPFDPPEILEADLSALVLDCARWGVTDPARLAWLDPPPAAGVAEARERLRSLDAIDEEGRATAHGRRIATLPLPPRLAHMLVRAGGRGAGMLAADIAVLLTERGLGGNDVDLVRRHERWRGERGGKAEAARGMTRRWAGLVAKDVAAVNDAELLSLGACVALAFPDRIARRRGDDGADWISAGGRGFRLDPLSPLARETWLAVAEVQGAASGARILSAAPIPEDEVLSLFAERVETVRSVRFRPSDGGVEALRERRLGAIRIASGPDDRPDPEQIAAALIEGVRSGGLDLLPWPESARSLRMRAAFAGEKALSDVALIDTVEMWLAPLLAGNRRLSAIDPGALFGAIEGILGWDKRQAIDRLAPPDFVTPAGTRHAIDYAAEGGPRVEVRVQALFGLNRHPTVGTEHIPLVLSLTSPAGRPIQTTRDLPGFWRGSWQAVAKEMRGRYPKHPWPDDPAAAQATVRTKRADARRG